MDPKADLNAVYIPSDDIVAREIEGELIIVPIGSGIGDMETELYTLNDTGQAIWRRLDGKTDLKSIIASLSEEFRAQPTEIEKDIMGLIEELLKRRMLIDSGKP